MKTQLLMLYVLLYVLTAFGGRALLQWKRTGSTGFRGLSGRPGSLAWLGGIALSAGFIAVLAAPFVAHAGALSFSEFALAAPVAWLCLAVGIVGTLWAQLAMGDSWRIGVDPRERTSLVQRGPFAFVRNPIFTSVIALALGMSLLLPGWLTVIGTLGVWAGLEIHVRTVEEPYLLRTHGDAYRRYASRVGRFVPALGRLAR